MNVNVVNFGAIHTSRQIAQWKFSDLNLKFNDLLKYESKHGDIVMQRFGNLKDVSPLVTLFPSLLFDYIAGSFIGLDGGMSLC
ncbi:hypothetical protein [Corynebacterium freiburgense]|uniref:hypothetical protein n=1 Tax=Corynebacterium freiburgense TaxID=556548 RepID=UPI000479C7A2|nr:hypothetical protein [Corynebacterium freiburgense]WJZ02934.1 hypothetical protein CFREI_08280 [Corynebacterium freiburgense]